ncbi:ficolin-2 [Plakobranchus ocellatus]|uniref:Ficolin-2 n=1 Tax=Plakobranchus ocellatus TaxID=259542 RepID=A0AAV4BRY4_9GAST|nr:ficolin-2 [Plakobranchus ocellatus]
MHRVTDTLQPTSGRIRGVGGTVARESALISAGTLLSRFRAPPPAPRPDGGLQSLRSPYCELAIYTETNIWKNPAIGSYTASISHY